MSGTRPRPSLRGAGARSDGRVGRIRPKPEPSRRSASRASPGARARARSGLRRPRGARHRARDEPGVYFASSTGCGMKVVFSSPSRSRRGDHVGVRDDHLRRRAGRRGCSRRPRQLVLERKLAQRPVLVGHEGRSGACDQREDRVRRVRLDEFVAAEQRAGGRRAGVDCIHVARKPAMTSSSVRSQPSVSRSGSKWSRSER